MTTTAPESREPIQLDAIQHRARFDFVRYANCWEDADVLVEAIRPEPGKRVLSIASSGDNALALLATGAEVVAADLNLAQLACLELRCRAFRELEHPALLQFLGVNPADDRLSTYDRIRGGLTSASRSYWDTHHTSIARGFIHDGKFEAYFRTFRTRVLPLIHSRGTVNRLLQPKSREAREQFWTEVWDNRRWRMLLRAFFSRFLMERLGRDKEFFRYVEGSIADHIGRRARYAMTALPTDENPYLQYIAVGNFTTALPRYLRPEHFEAIRSGLDRLTIFHGPIEQAAAEHRSPGFDGMNLSDIFEYISEETATQLYGKLLRTANVGARIAYWNAFVPRSCPRRYADIVASQTEQAAELFSRDKAFFYTHFRIDELQCPLDRDL